MSVIDFRSDTATLPSPEMREAMAAAQLGDDVAGEDPTANRIEQMAAEMLGMEASVFVSSGTMGNLVAALAQCRAGDGIIVGHNSHIYVAEAGGISTLGGISYRPLQTDERGMLDPQGIEEALPPDDIHYAPTKMVAIENTNNPSGGTVLTPEDTKTVADVAHAHDIALHVDGARIFNGGGVSGDPGGRSGQGCGHGELLPVQGSGVSGGLDAVRLGRDHRGGPAVAEDARGRDETAWRSGRGGRGRAGDHGGASG